MTEHEHSEAPRNEVFPQQWRIASSYDPNDHLMQLKGRDYLNVQNRLLWFIRDQREFILAGLAKVPYVIETELVEIDREAGWAHFRTHVRDVLGNEATMYGSGAAKDFPDYAEKASTKSLGRALLALGYGTAFAPEMDEGERVVDSPVERRRTGNSGSRIAESTRHSAPAPAATIGSATIGSATLSGVSDQPASEQQMISIRKLCAALGRGEPDTDLTYTQARQMITQLSGEYQRARRAS